MGGVGNERCHLGREPFSQSTLRDAPKLKVVRNRRGERLNNNVSGCNRKRVVRRPDRMGGRDRPGPYPWPAGEGGSSDVAYRSNRVGLTGTQIGTMLHESEDPETEDKGGTLL